MKRLIALLLSIVILSHPLSGLADAAIFKKTIQILQEGEKSKERDVALVFQDDRILVKTRNLGQVYAEIPNSAVTDLVYEKSAHPRVKTAIFISPLWLLSKSKKHWLTITYQEGDKSKFVLLKLDKKEYQRIIATAETNTGRKVQRVIE